MLEQLGLWLPSTFPSCTSHAPAVDLGTFCPACNERPVRIDYIGLEQSARVVSGSIRVDIDFDMHAKRIGHMPTSL
eukprot:3994248-Karenia_brevis.AAC.1